MTAVNCSERDVRHRPHQSAAAGHHRANRVVAQPRRHARRATAPRAPRPEGWRRGRPGSSADRSPGPAVRRSRARRRVRLPCLSSSRLRDGAATPPPCSGRTRDPSRGFAAVVPQFEPPMLPGIEIESSPTTVGMNSPPCGPGPDVRLGDAIAHRLVFLRRQQPRIDVVHRERLAAERHRLRRDTAAWARSARRGRWSAAPAVLRSARAARRSRD